MGRGYYYSLGFLLIHLLILIIIIQNITNAAYAGFIAVFLMFFVLSTIIISIDKRFRYPLMAAYFGSGIFFLLFIYYNIRTYLILPYAIISVAGYIYSIDKIKVLKKVQPQKKISDYIDAKNNNDTSGEENNFSEREIFNFREEQKQTNLVQSTFTPNLEVYNEEPKAKEPALFIGSKTSLKFHLPGCRYVKNISKKNKVTFSSLKDARDKSFKKCVCVKR